MRAGFAGLVIVFAFIIGCSSTPERVDQEVDASAEAVELSDSVDSGEVLMENLAPDFQLWPDGITFNDTTRMAVVYSRSFALHAIIARARSFYGEDLNGVVNVRMIIQPDGSVSSVELLDDRWSDPYASALTDSVLNIIEQWTFPPGLEKPLALQQPFKFHP
jgi:Gram-negative bacterial TonB protein C-terminal